MQEPTLDPHAVSQVWRVAQLAGASLLAGWLAEHLLESQLRVRGTAAIYGLMGFYVGTWLTDTLGWHYGPVLAGYAVLPIVLGAFVVAALAKFAGFGAAGPRR